MAEAKLHSSVEESCAVAKKKENNFVKKDEENKIEDSPESGVEGSHAEGNSVEEDCVPVYIDTSRVEKIDERFEKKERSFEKKDDENKIEDSSESEGEGCHGEDIVRRLESPSLNGGLNTDWSPILERKSLNRSSTSSSSSSEEFPWDSPITSDVLEDVEKEKTADNEEEEDDDKKVDDGDDEKVDDDDDEEDDDDVEEAEVSTILKDVGKYQRESAASLQKGLANLYTLGELSDLKVVVRKKVFHCHKVVLASFSNYFRTMVTSGMQESLRNEVTIRTIRPKCFKLILDYIYCGFDIFNQDEWIEEILEASVILQIRCIEEKCMELIASNMNTGNCLQIMELCERHACLDLASKARNMALKNFEQVMEDTDLLVMDREMLVDLMRDEQLKVSSEDVLCQVVMNWVEAAPQERSVSLHYLFRFICLPEVSGSFLYKRLLHNDLIQDDPLLKKQVDDAVRFQLVPDEREKVMMKQRVFRKEEKFRRVFLLIGGNITDDEIMRNVSCWDAASNSWFTLESVPQHVGEDFATCLVDNAVYLTGGSRNLTFAACFNPTENNWCLLPKLNNGRESHSMVEVDGNIYVLGGRDFKKKTKDKLVPEVEVYKNKETSWSVIGEMNPPKESFASSVFGSRIFIYCGHGAEGWTDDVSCFDVKTGAYSLITHLPQTEYHLQSVQAHKDEVHLVSTSGTIYSHKGDDQIRKLFHLPSFRRQRFSLTSDGVTITVIGGISEDGRCDRIDSISLHSRSMKPLGNLCIPMDGMRVHSVVTSKEYLVQRGMSIGEPEGYLSDIDD